MKSSVKRTGRSAVAATMGFARIGDLLPQLLARYGLHQRRNVEEIDAAWKTAIGKPFDAVCRVVGVNRGTLEIAVPHTAFVQELSFRKTELLQAMQTALPDEKIKRIKFFER